MDILKFYIIAESPSHRSSYSFIWNLSLGRQDNKRNWKNRHFWKYFNGRTKISCYGLFLAHSKKDASSIKTDLTHFGFTWSSHMLPHAFEHSWLYQISHSNGMLIFYESQPNIYWIEKKIRILFNVRKDNFSYKIYTFFFFFWYERKKVETRRMSNTKPTHTH